MRKSQTTAVLAFMTVGALAAIGIAGAACGGKHDDGDKASAGSAPLACRRGSVIKDGACLSVVTAEKIVAVDVQKSKLDELGKLLDRVDTAAAPIELLNGFRQLDQWQILKSKFDKLAALDALGDTFDNEIKTLRTLKASVAEASTRLGNLRGQMQDLLANTGATPKLEDYRAQISTHVRAVFEPLAAQVQDTLQNALLPLTTELAKISTAILGGCALSELSGVTEQMKQLCSQAQATFNNARTYLDELQPKPAQIFDEATQQVEAQLGVLVDTETRKLLDAAQAKVNGALNLPSASGAPPPG
jgi:hypothetical protein